MQIGNLHQLRTANRELTLPWGGSGAVQPDPFAELAVRDIFAQEKAADLSHIRRADQAGSGWTVDKDPSPERILRGTAQDPWGDRFVLALDLDPASQQPLSSTLTRSDGELIRSTRYQDGQLVQLVERRPWDDGTVESLEIQVNGNGTLSYVEKARGPRGG